MKVKELIEKLQKENPEADVHFAYPAGDYHRSTLAPPVRKVGEDLIEPSSYHRGFTVVEEGLGDDDAINVVVLR